MLLAIIEASMVSKVKMTGGSAVGDDEGSPFYKTVIVPTLSPANIQSLSAPGDYIKGLNQSTMSGQIQC